MLEDNGMPTLARLTIYPIKSLDGVPLQHARVLPSGALEHDRRWALVDADGKYFNGKRSARLQQVRSGVDLAHGRLELVDREDLATFSLREDREEIEQFFSLLLHERVRLVENATHGFPDDTDAPGPTVVSTATLETVANWFDLPPDEVRRRFRANVEIDGVEPFWEDRLYAAAGAGVPFVIGDVHFEGVNPCQRCVVPSRDSFTGQAMPLFTKRFAQQREATLPAWADRSRFNHFYRLAVNTRLAPDCQGGVLRIGDVVR